MIPCSMVEVCLLRVYTSTLRCCRFDDTCNDRCDDATAMTPLRWCRCDDASADVKLRYDTVLPPNLTPLGTPLRCVICRWSASIISQSVGSLFADHSGLVLAPRFARVRCAFPSDGGTRGSGDGGCGRGFCKAAGDPVWNCPYAADHLQAMLERHHQLGAPKDRYNEVAKMSQQNGKESADSVAQGHHV